MEDIEKIKEDLKQILSERRYEHSIGVMNMAEELAKIYKVDIEIAKIAGLLHDNAKEMTKEEMFKYEVILNGIYNKTKIEGEYKRFVYETQDAIQYLNYEEKQKIPEGSDEC